MYPIVEMSEEEQVVVVAGVTTLQGKCYRAFKASGWWTNPATGEDLTENLAKNFERVATKICLMHSELSAGLEGVRKNLNDSHLQHRSSVEVELADTVIRICDLAGALGLDLAGAIVEKIRYNTQRPDHKIENRKLARRGGAVSARVPVLTGTPDYCRAFKLYLSDMYPGVVVDLKQEPGTDNFHVFFDGSEFNELRVKAFAGGWAARGVWLIEGNHQPRGSM